VFLLGGIKCKDEGAAAWRRLKKVVGPLHASTLGPVVLSSLAEARSRLTGLDTTTQNLSIRKGGERLRKKKKSPIAGEGNWVFET